MSQQINLLNLSLRKQKEVLTPAHMVQACAGVLLVLCALSAYVYQQTRSLDAQRADWVKRSEDAKLGMARAAQQFPARQPSPMLQTEIKLVEGKIHTRDQVFGVLNSGVVGKTQGFSPLLEAFARQGVQGLWLTRIDMDAAGDRMIIGGNALSADLIPQYMTRLSAEQALHGRSFSEFKVGLPKPIAPAAGQPASVQAAPAASYVEFVLSAEKVEETPAKSGGKATEAKS